MTQNYEKHFHPDIGSHVTSLLFENFDNNTADRLRDEVTRVLANYEPRVAVNRVQVHADADNYGFYVNVFFFIVGQTLERSAKFFLERVR
jgi:phage baseplate assembly protein W